MKRMVLVIGGVLTLLASACGGAGHHVAAHLPAAPAARTTQVSDPSPPPYTTAPPGAATTTTSSTVAPDPAVVPPVINANYVNAVLEQLDHIYGNAFRLEVATNSIPPQAVDDVRAIYNDPQLNTELKTLSEQLVAGFSNSRHPPGDRVTQVVRLITATPSCIFFQARTDLSAVAIIPGPAAVSEYYMLQSKQPGHDPHGLNPTSSAYSYETTFAQPAVLGTKCPAA